MVAAFFKIMFIIFCVVIVGFFGTCFIICIHDTYTGKSKYENVLAHIKESVYPYQEMKYDVFVSSFPYLENYLEIKQLSSYTDKGEYFVVNLPIEKQDVKYYQRDNFFGTYIPISSCIDTKRYILLFPDAKQHHDAINFARAEWARIRKKREEKKFAERSTIDVLKYCQDAIQKDIEATQKKMADACEDIKEKVKEINHV